MNKQSFVKSLKAVIPILPRQTLKTIRGQALKGDVQGAEKGLEKVIRRYKSELHRNLFLTAHAMTRKMKMESVLPYRTLFSENLKTLYKIIGK